MYPLKIQPDKSIIWGDKSRIHSLLLNLGVNSSHAIHGDGQIHYRISVVTLDSDYCSGSPFSIREGEYLKLEVIDSGEGIEESVSTQNL